MLLTEILLQVLV